AFDVNRIYRRLEAADEEVSLFVRDRRSLFAGPLVLDRHGAARGERAALIPDRARDSTLIHLREQQCRVRGDADQCCRQDFRNLHRASVSVVAAYRRAVTPRRQERYGDVNSFGRSAGSGRDDGVVASVAAPTPCQAYANCRTTSSPARYRLTRHS